MRRVQISREYFQTGWSEITFLLLATCPMPLNGDKRSGFGLSMRSLNVQSI